MCLFTSGVTDVSDTRIFVRKEGARRQILAYQMTLQADDELAMVLPLPVGERDESSALEFINMEKCERFFDTIASLLAIWEDDDVSFGSSLGSDAPPVTRPVLEVHRVGDYEASFVPSIADFSRGVLHCYHRTARYQFADVVQKPWARQGQYGASNSAVIRIRYSGVSGASYEMVVGVLAKEKQVRTAVLQDTAVVPYSKRCQLEEWSS